MEGNKEPECDTQPRLSFDIFSFLLSADVFLSLSPFRLKSLALRPEESVINLAPVTHSIVLIQWGRMWKKDYAIEVIVKCVREAGKKNVKINTLLTLNTPDSLSPNQWS